MKRVFLTVLAASLILVLMLGLGTGCAPEEKEVAPDPEEPEDVDEPDEEVEFPTDTVEIVVGFDTGATADVLGRGLATRLSELWDVSVVVENMPGANQATAYHHVADADSDGHTLFIGVMQTMGQHEYRGTIDVPLQDMEWLGFLLYEPYSIFVPADAEMQTFEDLMAQDHVTYGDTGIESALQPFIVTLLDAIDVDFDFIPGYAGGDLHSATLAGEIDFMARGPAYMHRLGMEEDFETLVVSSDERHPARPDTPSLTEVAEEYDLDIEPDPLYDLGFPIAATPGTPQEAIDELVDTIEYLYSEDEEFNEWLEEQGIHWDADPKLIGHDVAEDLVADYIQGYEEIGLEELEERLE